MRKSLFSLVTASVLLSGAGLASAQTTTTTTTQWTPDQRSSITQYQPASITNPSATQLSGQPSAWNCLLPRQCIRCRVPFRFSRLTAIATASSTSSPLSLSAAAGRSSTPGNWIKPRWYIPTPAVIAPITTVALRGWHPHPRIGPTTRSTCDQPTACLFLCGSAAFMPPTSVRCNCHAPGLWAFWPTQ